MNLLCAQGLPGAQAIDIKACLEKIDGWAAKVKFHTDRHLYRASHPAYPLKLVAAKAHLFIRWDNGKERFNIEGATNGGIASHDDNYYLTWPLPLSDEERQAGH